MSDDKTMQEFYEEQGYDTDDLVHPKNVDPASITEDSVVIAYTVVRNPDPDAPATMYDLVEYELSPTEVFTAEGVKEETDGDIRFVSDEISYAVRWAYRSNGTGKFSSIGYGDVFDVERDDAHGPQSWDRLVVNVRGLSDDFLRFKV